MRYLAAIALAAAATPAWAGPPYLTYDPVPTDPGHWEIYDFTAATGFGADIEDDTGFDINYGGAKELQLTATLPLSITHEASRGWHGGTGDVELAAKYRFLDQKSSGVSVALFPRVILPTASTGTCERTRFLLPIWFGKDLAGGTSVFGGGGYEVNPGAGNRGFWQAGITVTQDVAKGLNLGVEAFRQGPDVVGSTAETDLGGGAIVHLAGPASLLLSGGPTWANHRTGYHVYAALGLDL